MAEVQHALGPAQSAEEIAFRLFEMVAWSEGRQISDTSAGSNRADRTYILDTFAECLSAVEGGRLHKPADDVI